MTAVSTGKRAEALACRYLRRRGYRLLARNYRAGRHELDLVMRQGERIVFVEVRARSSTAFGAPAETIGAAKRRFLNLAAQAYLLENDLTDAPARFDVIEVYLDEDARIRHIEDAFGCDGA